MTALSVLSAIVSGTSLSIAAEIDVLGADDVRLDGLERVVLARGHLLERGGVDDHVDAARGDAQAVAVAHVAEQQRSAVVVEASSASSDCLSSSRLNTRIASTS